MLTQFYKAVKRAAAGATGELQGPSKGDCLEVQAFLKRRGVSGSLETVREQKALLSWRVGSHRIFDFVYYTCARRYTAACTHLWLHQRLTSLPLQLSALGFEMECVFLWTRSLPIGLD